MDEDLFKAVATNNLSVLEKASNVTLQKIVGPGNYTLLHEAAHYSNEETITFLLERWHDINIKDELGNTPLIEAVNYKNKHAVVMLLTHLADPSSQNNSSYTALWYACAGNNESAVKSLLQYGADPNEKYSDGSSPLITAAEYNSSAIIIQDLIQHGANINAEGPGGFTALIYAILSKNKENIRLLLFAGASKDLLLQDGRTLESFLKEISDQNLRQEIRSLLK